MAKSVRKVGDWDKARKLVNNLDIDIKQSQKVVLRKVGALAERFMVKWIQRQPGIWPGLNKKYLSQKVEDGYSKLMLRRTGTMINNITSEEKYPQVFVGLKRGLKYHEGIRQDKNGVYRNTKGQYVTKKAAGEAAAEKEVANIAWIMEFGSEKRNIPARPFLRPTLRYMIWKISRENLFGKYLLEHLRKKYGI